MLLRAAGLRAAVAAVPHDPAGEWLGAGWSTFLTHSQPLLLGVPLLAAAAGAIGYFATQGIWRRRVLARRAARRTEFKADTAATPAFTDHAADKA